MGADDYVVKPVGMDEFLARVGALLRRRSKNGVAAAPDQSGYSDKVLRIDQDRHEVWVRGEKVEFTPTEFRLLCFLTDRGGKTCGLREILSRVWDSPHYPFEVVKWHIARLRSKVEEDPRNPAMVITVRGVGYRYDPPS
jgi:DNA-binding response OmpR family regulator